MDDVAMRRTLAALVIAAAVALLVVGGAMLFGMGKPAQAQSDPEPPCTENFCLDKTADPNPAIVGEPITFTISERCVSSPSCQSFQDIVDTVPSGLSIVSVDDSQPDYQCSTSENTVTCPGGRFITPTSPFTLTIVATPTECGSFTNTASKLVGTAQVTFTVEGCVPPGECDIVGTRGDDDLTGTAEDDVICGRQGEDTISGLGGNDTLLGGKGSDADVIRGGSGDDTLLGGNARDSLIGGGGADELRGQFGRDTLDATDGVSGNDEARGGPEEDTCEADAGDEVVGCEN